MLLLYLGNKLWSLIGREPISWRSTKTHAPWLRMRTTPNAQLGGLVTWKVMYTAGVHHLDCFDFQRCVRNTRRFEGTVVCLLKNEYSVVIMFKDNNRTLRREKYLCYQGITKPLLHAMIGVHGFSSPRVPFPPSGVQNTMDPITACNNCIMYHHGHPGLSVHTIQHNTETNWIV